MSQSSDLDVLKDIPGYKAILKSVLKSQIQLLIEQLADQTGEESIILTASINDGTLSHLGSCTGKGFLEGRDDMKSQFLGYCLKTHHRKKTMETKSPPYQRSNQRHMPYKTPSKRVHPVALQRAMSGENLGPGLDKRGASHLESDSSGNNFVKQEEDNPNPPEIGPSFTSTPASFPSSLQLSHTQTSADLDQSGQVEGHELGETGDSVTHDSDGTNDSSAANIKIEPITENEMELEITGVEPGHAALTQDEWSQGQMGYGPSGAEDDSSLNQSADGSGYSLNEDGHLEDTQPENSTSFINHLVYDETLKALYLKSRVKKNQCHYCPLRFKKPCDLRRHVMIHTGERPFECEVCHKSFNRKGTLKGHFVSCHLKSPVPGALKTAEKNDGSS